MSDLISRESIVTLLEQYGYIDKEMERDLEAIPSADILECARAIKEYCRDRRYCDECRYNNEETNSCRLHDTIPIDWDLPEGEKE